MSQSGQNWIELDQIDQVDKNRPKWIEYDRSGPNKLNQI